MFNKDSTLSEILRMKDSEKILVKYNLPCLRCPLAGLEMEHLKIGQICKTYGIDLKTLLRDLNRKILKKKKVKK